MSKLLYSSITLSFLSILLFVILIFSITTINNIYKSPLFSGSDKDSNLVDARKYLIISTLFTSASLWFILLFLTVTIWSASSIVKIINYGNTSFIFIIMLIIIILSFINIIATSILSFLSLLKISGIDNKDQYVSNALEYNIVVMVLSWICVLITIILIISYISIKFYKNKDKIADKVNQVSKKQDSNKEGEVIKEN